MNDKISLFSKFITAFLLILICFNANNLAAKEAVPLGKVNVADQIFLEYFENYAFYDLHPKTLKLLNFKPKWNFTNNLGGKITPTSLRTKIAPLPLGDKCRLALMVYFFTNVDGEKSESFNYAFKPFRVKIGKRILRISLNDLKRICDSYKVSYERIKTLRERMSAWAKNKP